MPIPPVQRRSSPHLFVPPTRWVCVVLHDVAPARWASCRRIIDEAQALAAAHGLELRLSLLVVPCLHGEATSREFVSWLQRLADDGHEIVLHGWRHVDDVPVKGWRDRLLRRTYTAGEGEFAALGFDDSALRIAKGQAWLLANGLRAQGFVAPAWLMSSACAAAVMAAGFAYTCTLTRLISLPGRQWLQARSLVFSTRSAWRRAASVAWNTLQAWVQRDAPLLRLELHPGDIEHATVHDCWLRVLDQALATRHPVTMAVAAGRLLSAPVLPLPVMPLRRRRVRYAARPLQTAPSRA